MDGNVRSCASAPVARHLGLSLCPPWLFAHAFWERPPQSPAPLRAAWHTRPNKGELAERGHGAPRRRPASVGGTAVFSVIPRSVGRSATADEAPQPCGYTIVSRAHLVLSGSADASMNEAAVVRNVSRL